MTLIAEVESLRAEIPPVKAPQLKKRKLDRVTRLILIAIVLIIAALVLWPLYSILREGFSAQGLEVLGSLSSPTTLRIIGNTLLLGAVVGAGGTLVGFIMAYAQARVQFRGKRLLHLIALLPIVSPPFAVATAFITLFSRNGIISSGVFGLTPNVYGLPGLSFVLMFSFFPVAYMNMLGMLRNLDPSLDEASASLGATRFKTFWRVTVPMLLPGFAASFLLLFVEAIADLANPLVLGGNFTVLSTRAYMAINGEFNVPGASAYAIMLLVPALLVFLVQRYWVSRTNVTTVTGKPAGRVSLITSPLARIPILTFVGLVITTIVLIYGTVAVGGFVSYLGVDNTFTLANYQYILGGIGSDAILTTTLLAVVATPIAAVIGMTVSWLVVRKLTKGSGAMDFLAMLGLAVPGTVLGIGYAVAYNKAWIVGDYMLFPALAGGAAILGGTVGIVMVFVTRSLPTSVRSGVAAIQQISPAIDEAATSLGANSVTTFRTITLPLIRAALLTGLTYAFARSMTTLSPIIFITTPQTKIMTSQILGSVESGKFGIAFAYCSVLIILVMSVIGLISFLTSDKFYRIASAWRWRETIQQPKGR